MKSLEELSAIRERMRNQAGLGDSNSKVTRVLVGMATCGIASGARSLFDALTGLVEENKIENVNISQTGCIGLCQYEPMFEIITPGKNKVTYVKMNEEKTREVFESHILHGVVLKEYTIDSDTQEAGSLDHNNFYKDQSRVALRNCGVIDPEKIDEYIALQGYEGLKKAVTTMSPKDVIKTISDAGLRGRGGAGFPTGTKWKFAADKDADQKYVCCNADEGDPGAFMDRSVLEGDPHVILEAMAIAGYAIGASEGYIYVRAEYPIAIARLEIAINQAKKYGLLGKNIFDTDFSFNITLRLGAGAFVCGEETALMTSIEGNRGEPRPRPPFPADKGLFNKPTILNNVETLANVPQIILNGSEWFSSIGTEKSKGTKVFALGGKINHTGLVEIPMGTTLREIVEDIGGGIPNDKEFKAAQTGGPSGGCIPKEHFDIKIDYENLLAIGSMMGSGGLIVMDEDNCMVDIAKFFLEFTVDESCGKCVPCRVGTKRMWEILDKITKGEGSIEDIEKLEDLCYYIKDNALCGLGQTAPNPVLSTLRYFRDEYISHVVDKQCPAKVCKNLLRMTINPSKCIGCTLCAKNCPVEAITGNVREVHYIDPEKCIMCEACSEICKKGAIIKS